MDKSTFVSSQHVIAFTDWLAAKGDTLSIDLDIKSTRFVPGGIRTSLTGFGALLQNYRWMAKTSATGDWVETRERLRELSKKLKQGILARNDEAALAACDDILDWGGNRNPRVGALPYLTELCRRQSLVQYLDTACRAFTLDSAVIDERTPQAARMNSMLTKVHALASSDGLPIYDSRVAAAIAALVELWRRDQGQEQLALSRELAFPATTPDRSVHHLFDDAQAPEVMSYAKAAQTDTAARWSSAKIRLGWLMGETLAKAPGLFTAEREQDRMHAFEACLFMIGYDVASLRRNRPGISLDDKTRAKRERIGRDRLRREQASLPRKTISTLARNDGRLEYAGDAETGVSGKWGATPFAFDSDFLQAVLAHFPSGREAGLGASMMGDVQADTLGFWINEHYPKKPRRYASALAAILVDQGLAERVIGPQTVRIRFL